MAYADNANCFMFVLNGEWLPKWQLHNARGHVAIGLATNLGSESEALKYEIPAFEMTSYISRWPVIDKVASSSQLISLIAKLAIPGIKMNIFTDTMFGKSAEEQISNTNKSKEPIPLVIGLFGDSKLLKTLTKEFKLTTY